MKFEILIKSDRYVFADNCLFDLLSVFYNKENNNDSPVSQVTADSNFAFGKNQIKNTIKIDKLKDTLNEIPKDVTLKIRELYTDNYTEDDINNFFLVLMTLPVCMMNVCT